MNQVLAEVIQNERVMGPYPPGNILHSRVIQLNCPEVARNARPGQFVMVHCGSDTLLRRPLSIHQVDGDRLSLLYAVIRKGTQWLAGRQPGEAIDLIGPLGNGFMIPPDSNRLLLVAGGMGIAPLYFLAEDALRQGKAVTMLYGTATEDRYHVPLGVTEFAATEDDSVGYCGLVTDLIPEHIGWADQVFACGPLPMYKAMLSMPELNDKSVQVSLEMRMGCGLGVCYACTIKTVNGLKQVCQDGPIFELSDIMWGELGLS